MTHDNDPKGLQQLKSLEVSPLDMARWKRAVQKELKQPPRFRWRLDLVAAVFLGVVLGAAAVHFHEEKRQVAIDVAATFERSRANLDQEDL